MTSHRDRQTALLDRIFRTPLWSRRCRLQPDARPTFTQTHCALDIDSVGVEDLITLFCGQLENSRKCPTRDFPLCSLNFC